jgi:RNA polymerase sigma-70 factor, ECF subfamily
VPSPVDTPRAAISTTAALLRSAQRGDPASREALAQRCLPRLRRMALGRVNRGSALDPEDAVQETLLKAFSHLETFTPRCEGAFILYLRRILLNVLVDHGRKAARRPRPASLEEEPEARGAGPVEEAVGTEAWERYRAAVEELSEAQKEAVVLFVECGMDFPEIAEAIESPSADAARMLVARGVKKLSQLMREPG